MNGKKLSAVGWILTLLFLYLASKSKTGYNVIYYVLVLIIVFLLLSNYKRIETMFYK